MSDVYINIHENDSINEDKQAASISEITAVKNDEKNSELILDARSEVDLSQISVKLRRSFDFNLDGKTIQVNELKL